MDHVIYLVGFVRCYTLNLPNQETNMFELGYWSEVLSSNQFHLWPRLDLFERRMMPTNPANFLKAMGWDGASSRKLPKIKYSIIHFLFIAVLNIKMRCKIYHLLAQLYLPGWNTKNHSRWKPSRCALLRFVCWFYFSTNIMCRSEHIVLRGWD